MKESFIGEPITPGAMCFAAPDMARGLPGVPQEFCWRGETLRVLQVLREWKECGDCRHGSGERYVRKHWFRIRTTGDFEMSIYFERQRRSSGGSRWRLYSLVSTKSAVAE